MYDPTIFGLTGFEQLGDAGTGGDVLAFRAHDVGADGHEAIAKIPRDTTKVQDITGGLLALPVLFFPFLIVATLTYLGLVELAKRGLLGHIASSQRHDGGP